MKKLNLTVFVIMIYSLLGYQILLSQTQAIHFSNVGGKTKTNVVCNTHGSGFFDYNGDNLPDIFIVHNESFGDWSGLNLPHALLKNMGDGTFQNVTKQVRVQGSSPRTSAQGFAAADFDNNGKTDFVIANGHYPTEKVLLYWQDNDGIFWNATNASKVYHKNRGRNVAFVDYNNDGLVDLFSFGDTRYSNPSLLVYRNIGNANFLLQSKEAGLEYIRDSKDIWGFAFADIDNDGDMDFFDANYESDCHLFINNGDGTFTEQTEERGIVKQNRYYGAIFLDYNNDGWFDLYTRRCDEKSILYKNNKDGTFIEVTPESGVWERLGRAPYGGGLSVADFNNDGYIDILVVSSIGTGFRLYRNNGDGTFTDVAGSSNIKEKTRFNYSAPIADYNRDGYLDVFLARTDSKPPKYYTTLFENSGGENHWLHVKLVGEQSNRDAIGTRVVAYTNGKLQMRQVLGGDCYKMDSLPVEFGLAGNSVVDSLIIYWPSGIVQREMLVPADTFITITEEDRVYYHSFIVSGEVNYYKKNKEVPSVKLQMTGSKSMNTYSNENGLYKFPVNRGYNKLDIIASKTTDSDVGECVISAYDAALTARSAEGIENLTGFPAKAADVNINNIIDQTDPLLIAKKAVGLPNSNGSHTGDWYFDPSMIHIERMMESNFGGQNFISWLLGDVDGDWTIPDGSTKNSVKQEYDYYEIYQGDSTVTIGLSLPGNILMLSSDLWLEYDPSLFSVREINTTSLTDDFKLVYNNSIPGILKIALFNSVSVWKEDEFLQITFDIIPEVIEDTTQMHWQHFRINDTEYDKEDIILDLRTFTCYGKVKYFQQNTLVPEVKLIMQGAREDETFTNNQGVYQFLGIKAGNNIIVTPSKERAENVENLVISSYDAFLTARHAANIEHLYGIDTKVADVDINNSIEMQDAQYIARASVGFANNEISHAGDWKFSPVSFSYNNIKENVEKDFTAYILGDVNGDWLYNQSSQSINMNKMRDNNSDKADRFYTADYEISIPLSLNEGDSLGCADIWGEYNESALELIGIRKSEELTSFYLTYNDTIPGRFKIALFSTKYGKNTEDFLTLTFRVITKEIEETTLRWQHFRINNKEYDKNNIIIDTGVNDYSFSGEVIFYQDSVGVSSTKLQMHGTANKESITDKEGYYIFPEVSKSDSIIVSPYKEKDEDVGYFTISAYDAVLAARHTVGLDSLSGYSLKAADVDTNGIIDMLDAVFIAKRSIGITDSEYSRAGAWHFSPESQTCSYVSENVTDQDFTAYIMGDIDGSWKHEKNIGKAVMADSPVTVHTEGNDEFCLPLINTNVSSLLSANIWLEYDPTVLKFVDIKKNASYEKFHLIYNNSASGEVKIALFGLEPVKDIPEFLHVYFTYISHQKQETTIKCKYWCINNSEYYKDNFNINTGIDDDYTNQLNFKLNANYPNPFNPETTINYQIANSGRVRLKIYNSQGRMVRCLVDDVQNPGIYSIKWDGLDDTGNEVVSGLYFCRLSSKEKFEVIKMVKLK